MQDRPIERKLAAIFYADVAGYSRLTGLDEEGTHRRLSEYLDVISSAIEESGGRVVHYAGDAVLADFKTVVEAVSCAISIQRDLAVRNQPLPEDRRVEFRIGINLGDVMVDRNDIYGDGVNVAARLEGLADVGGICISGAVHDQVRNRMDVGFEPMGRQQVKNIAEPISAFRVVLDGTVRKPARQWSKLLSKGRIALAVAFAAYVVGAGIVAWYARDRDAQREVLQAESELAIPQKPSIAVLPFDNLSDDSSQEYFADGISEDIITSLSQVSNLFVIARNSSFTYKGRAVKIQTVARELGVRYVLEGSVQKSGGRIRVNAQLIDGANGRHLWADRFDRELKDLFEVQDEITRKICTALAVNLTEGEQFRVWSKSSRNIEAWEFLNRGIEQFHHFDKDSNVRGRELMEKAIEIDYGYALAYGMLAWSHWLDAQYRWTEHPQISFERAEELAIKAMALDDTIPDNYALMGAIHLFKRQYAEAIAAGEKAVALSPNHATNTALLAMTQVNAGNFDEAILGFDKARRLSPYPADWFLEAQGWAYLWAGRSEEAVQTFEEYLQRKDQQTPGHNVRLGMALAFAEQGRENDARKAVGQELALSPHITLGGFRGMSLFHDKEALHRKTEVLGRLGLPQ
ncbi:MAG: adenylate/guanylate cyclase domain-containing protein [Rhodospirillales bacterium]|jgi:adenylate cyclase|nr:adenylate/guanylate cyclase domain-containing protein [Rhodospirillales bacterium]